VSDALATVQPTFATWEDVHAFLAGADYHRIAVVPKGALPDPATAGANRSLGLPVGQTSDWRFPPDAACQGLHVQDFGDCWHVHLDIVHPTCDLLGHLRADAPRFGAYATLTGLGALAGGVYKGGKGAILGATAGILTALLVDFAAACLSTKTPTKLTE
jgi:hypothetical protein